MNPFNVISYGDLVTDIIVQIPEFPVLPQGHQMVSGIQTEPGGAGNFLIAGARLGMNMIPLGVIGKDFFGEETLRILAEEGIITAPVLRQKEGSTTTVFVLVDRKGQHVFLGQYGQGPDIQISKSWKRHLQTADAVHFWGYTFQEERMVDSVLEAMVLARQEDRLVVFDPGPYMKTASKEYCKAVLANCQVILLTEDEISPLTGGKGDLNEVPELLGGGVELVCVKRGAHGCVIITRDQTVMHPGFPVEVRDTSAAGDSFAAAFTYGYLQAWPLPRVAAFANAMGAAKVRKLGSGRQVPTFQEVRAVLDQFQEGSGY